MTKLPAHAAANSALHPMARFRQLAGVLLAACALMASALAGAQTAAPGKTTRSAAPSAPRLEAKAMDLLRGMSGALAAASSLSFTAVTSYESPSSLGPALVYSTTSDVLLQRPDRLRVVTLGDGPAAEYSYDGRTLTTFAPAENLVAISPAPPTIDLMLKAAFDKAAIYFPFADIVGADPFANLTQGLTRAFYIGQSKVVGGTTTDMVAVASDAMFMQIWIGAEDKLPRRMRAVFKGDPLLLRHDVQFSNWKLDPLVAADAFAALNAANAKKIDFAVPQSGPTRKAAKGKPSAKQGARP